MFSKNGLSIKELIFTTGLALGGQNLVAANNNLPCPTNSPILDSVGVLQNDIKSQIENRLLTLDKETKHQVTLITVKTPEEYGYDDFASMGADMINECKIGYRGANTGVIVFYGSESKKHYFISTANGVEGYIPDATVQDIGRKSLDDCSKGDYNCRLNSITGSLDSIIRDNYKDESQTIERNINDYDKQNNNSSDIDGNLVLGFLGVSGGIVLLGFGGYQINRKIKISKEIKELNKKILDLQISLGLAKEKFPEWFADRYINTLLSSINSLGEVDEATLNTINNKFEDINNDYLELDEKYNSIISDIEPTKQQILLLINMIKSLNDGYDKSGYKYDKKEFSLPKDSVNPEATLSSYDALILEMENYANTLKDFESSYRSSLGTPEKLIKELDTLKKTYLTSLGEYENIFGKSSKQLDFGILEKSLNDYIKDFNEKYLNKDIRGVSYLYNKSNNFFSEIETSISNLNSQISWYNSIPSKISEREKELGRYNYSPDYERVAREYRNESGKSDFDNFDMQSKLSNLTGILANIKGILKDKKGFEKVDSLFNDFDSDISKIGAYVGLGIILARLIEERLAEEARRLEEERIKKEKEKEEEEEDERLRNYGRWSNDNDDDKGDDDTWSKGGGGGGEGAGGGFD